MAVEGDGGGGGRVEGEGRESKGDEEKEKMERVGERGCSDGVDPPDGGIGIMLLFL